MNRFAILYSRHRHDVGLWAKPETAFEGYLQAALKEWLLAHEDEKASKSDGQQGAER